MKTKLNRIKKLSETFATLLEQERKAIERSVSTLIESVQTIQGETSDRRLQHLSSQLNSLQNRLSVLTEMGRRDFLAKIHREAQELSAVIGDSRAAAIMTAMVESPDTALNPFCDSMLDRLIEATGAERGFVLFYHPESTEADVISARNFETKNLSLEEYDFSRTLLRAVLDRGESLLIEDASNHPVYSEEHSVIKFQLRSVLAAALKQGQRTVGAIYLEHNTRPCAFDEDDPLLVEKIAQFAIFYLRQAHLLPPLFERENRVFLDETKASKEIIGSDPKVLALLETIERLADSPATVLIEGESGTGKELVARALHYQSARYDRPFIAINCAAIPDNLLESELFGHEKGAFTGATGRYIGRIEQGNCGTIFLDEVSELAYPLQAKLLRFLQSSEFDRLGGTKTVRIDVRVVAATSKDLKALTEAGKFQEALYYRLNVVPVRMPALRERKGDIPLLIDFFLEKFAAVYLKEMRMEPVVRDCLKEYRFPGNVRELENLVHRLVALAANDIIDLGNLPDEILHTRAERVSLQNDSLPRILETRPADLEEFRRRKRLVKRALAEQELALIEDAVQQSGGNLTEAASRLGMHRITLHKILRRAKEPNH